MKTTLHFLREQLRDFYPDTEIESFWYLILESVCSLNKSSVLRGKDKQLSSNEFARIQEIVEELKKQRPIQYILGEVEFYGLKFKVDENVLIPRPETEELVEWIAQEKAGKDWNILDIGTGSGCIAVAVAKLFPEASVYAMDISEKALEVAHRNAELNRVIVHYAQQDLLAGLPDHFPKQWNIIVSNPPYVTPKEKETMASNVLDYEPHQALFVPQENPLLFYEQIADIGRNHLKEDGSLYLEINAQRSQATVKMLENKRYRSVKLLKDISGNDRMIVAKL